MVLVGLRGTRIFRFFEAGHKDAVVALRSVHHDYWSFAAYLNLLGQLGARQQQDILTDSFDNQADSMDDNATQSFHDATVIGETTSPQTSSSQRDSSQTGYSQRSSPKRTTSRTNNRQTSNLSSGDLGCVSAGNATVNIHYRSDAD